MWGLEASDESQNAASLAGIAALASQSGVRITGDTLRPPKPYDYLYAIYGLGANLDRLQLRSVAFQKMLHSLDVEIEGWDKNAEPTNIPGALHILDYPLTVVENGRPNDEPETVEALHTEDASSAARSFVLWWFWQRKILPIPNGEIRTFRFTNGSTLTTDAWTNGALTASVPASVPQGDYAVVGMAARSAGLIAARLVFPTHKFNPKDMLRPGCIGRDNPQDIIEGDLFRKGRLGGVWGYFNANNLPTVDFLSISADTSQVVLLDCIKV